MPAPSEGDLLLQSCCVVPSDRARHLILADWLAEHDEAELEAVMRSEGAERLVILTHSRAVELKRPPCLRLLWAIALLGPRQSPPNKLPDFRWDEVPRPVNPWLPPGLIAEPPEYQWTTNVRKDGGGAR